MTKYRLVRGSEVSDFLRCRKRWKHKWVDHLKPKRPEGKLFFGNLFHVFAEEYYMANERREEIAKEWMRHTFETTDTSRMAQTEIDDLWDLAVGVTDGYVKQWGERDRNIRVIATEFTFAIPLANGIAYTGTIDKLWLDEEGRLWFADYKTTASIEKYIKRAPMDRQISRYFWALKELCEGNGYVWDNEAWWPVANTPYWKQLGETRPHGFIYDIVMRDVPRKPELLKKGGLSKAKNQKTTYQIYLDTMVENDLTTPTPQGSVSVPEEYEEILAHFRMQETEQGNAFFRRIPVYRQPEELESAIQEFYAVAYEMVHYKTRLESGVTAHPDYDPIYRNITDDCSWDCSFQSMCVAQMDGSWYADMEELFYEKEEPGMEWLDANG